MLQSVPLEKCSRLLNHGPTVLVSAQHGGRSNVMAAAWACVLDYMPVPKVSVVLSKESYTRTLIEQSGRFALQIPVARQARMVLALGSESGKNNPDKAAKLGAKLFHPSGCAVPLVEGCAGWLACELLPNAVNQQEYDLFIGKVLSAWADDTVFRNGHWHFDEAGDDWRTLHYMAGGQFYLIGKGLYVKQNTTHSV